MSPQKLPPRPPIFPFASTDPETPRIRVDWVEQQRNLNQHPNPAHVHQFPEIIYCEQDGGSHRLGTQHWNARAGDLFLIAPYEIHDADTLGTRWVLQFTVDAIAPNGSTLQDTSDFTGATSPSENALLNIYSNPLLLPFLRLAGSQSVRFNIPRQQQPKWTQLLQSLETELRLKQCGYKEAARAYLTLLLVEITRLTTDRPELSFQEHPLLTEVFQFIETHYTESISLTDVAEAVGRSSAYLTTFVGHLTGRTVLEWIAQRRMAQARRLLLETDENLNTICNQVGYRDRNGFIRLFRRLYGTTPGAWRRANR
jgi:AraC family transcriptional regulator, transcriptional activator of pobA